MALQQVSGNRANRQARRAPARPPLKNATTSSAPARSFGEPSLSPDGSEIAFVSGGDIWTAPSSGGEARLLVAHPATESRPLYSPDGKKLAFMSNRTGAGNIYTLDVESGDVKRLTFNDGKDQLEGWSPDGRYIYFSAATNDIGGSQDIFRIDANGGTPMPVSADRFANEYFSAPSPKGSTLAFTGDGYPAQWWRHGHSHLDESRIWLMDEGDKSSYRPLTEPGARDLWPMWNPDGRRLYYVSDRSGAENIWTQPVNGKGAPQQVTQFKDGRVLWPSISQDGKTIVFERDFGIWKLDTTTGETSAVPLTRRGAAVGPATTHQVFENEFDDMTLSPDGKKVALVAHGEVFVASAEDGGNAAQVTHSAANESHVVWAPDSRRLVYVSDRDGAPHLYQYDCVSGSESRLTGGDASDSNPCFSPDGKQLAFIRDGKQLCALDLATRQERVLATNYFGKPPFDGGRPYAWSPDNQWVAYLGQSTGAFVNVFAVPTSGGEARPISFLPNTQSGEVSWSADGRYVTFDTSQRTEKPNLARIELSTAPPTFKKDTLHELFASERSKDETQPIHIDFDGIKQRLSLLPVDIEVQSHRVSPDGTTALITASSENQVNLYTYPLGTDASSPKLKQLTNSPRFKSDAQFAPDGKSVYYLEGGAVKRVALNSGDVEVVGITAEMDVKFDDEKKQVFNQAWRYLRDNFFDPQFNGVDWDAVHARWEPQIAGASTPDEVYRLLSLMLGELNASHMGISSPNSNGINIGRLGLDFDRDAFEQNGKLRVSSIVPNGAAARAGGIAPGDTIDAVNGVPVGPHSNLDEMLNNQIGHRVTLTVSSDTGGRQSRQVDVSPIDNNTERTLRYRQWVQQNRDYVSKASGGRLGYIHIPDMSAESLDQLYLDLDADNQNRDGVVIDVRNNNGGFVNAYALDVLSRRGYLDMTPRDQPEAPARRVLGQRTLDRPTVLLTNKHCLSDGEDFTEGYRAMQLGKVVGEPTAGWIIFTSGAPLIDGSMLRLPFVKVTAHDGSPMEMNPRPVDVPVARPMGESYSGKDGQLDAAVQTLLTQIDAGKKPVQ
jgi:Tol biopolymer transport system component/C-terminal processing protease CtpA/Prc